MLAAAVAPAFIRNAMPVKSIAEGVIGIDYPMYRGEIGRLDGDIHFIADKFDIVNIGPESEYVLRVSKSGVVSGFGLCAPLAWVQHSESNWVETLKFGDRLTA